MAGQLVPFQLRSPGVFGVVTEQEGAIQDPRWATVLKNAVINASNRIAARNGWVLATTGGNHGEDTETIYEFVEDADTTYIISAAGTGADAQVYSGTVTLIDRSNAADPPLTQPTASDWQFVSLNGFCLGFQAGHEPIFWEPSGTTEASQSDDFEDITGATGYVATHPDGNAAVATHGRIFAFDDDMQTVKWCALLDPFDWGGASAGAIDLRNIWPRGGDVGVALEEWNDYLVIFGERSILVFSGLEDPNVKFGLAGGTVDTAEGQQDAVTGDGLVARDAFASVGTELIYLSRSGLRSLRRALIGQNLPLTSIAPQIQLALTVDINAAINAGLSIKVEYHRPLGAIVAKIGAKYWYFDVRDQRQVKASTWEGIGWLAAASIGGTLYLGENDGIATYTGFADGGESYLWEYKSPWLPLTGRSAQSVIVKQAEGYYEADLSQSVSLSWSFDYVSESFSEAALLDVGNVSEWNEDEFGIAEWGTSGTLVRQKYEGAGDGALIQFGVRATINGGNFAVQEVDFIGKLGRILNR